VNGHADQMHPSLQPLRLALPRTLIGRVLHRWYRLFGQRRHREVVLERVDGTPLLVMPGVLNPRLMRSGAFFASRLGPELIRADAKVLDMGTGSGICALIAARYARSVSAIDISAAAVRCTHLNVLLNGLEDRITVLQGDLFVPVSAQRFDVVLFNPPFKRGAPRNDPDRAWRSSDVAERFAASLPQHLTPAGCALVVLSTYGDAAAFVREFERRGFTIEVIASRSFVNERLSLVRLRPTARGASRAVAT